MNMKKKKSVTKKTTSVIIISSLVILTAFIILSGLYAYKLLDDDSIKLAKTIDEIIESSKSGDWERSANEMHKIDSDWRNMKHAWSSLIDHEEIDNIDVTLSRLQILNEVKDITSLLPEAAALKKLISHIPEKESLTIDNIF